MLAGRFRASKSSVITNTYKFGKSANHPLFYIKAKKDKLPHSKAAVVVPKSISKLAVVRNRNKRRINEVLRLNWQKITPGYSIIITVKADNLKIDFKKLEKDILQKLAELNVLK